MEKSEIKGFIAKRCADCMEQVGGATRRVSV